MPLLGGNYPAVKRYSEGFEKEYIEDVEFCAELVRQYMYEEAWSLINTLRQESIPLLINKALCLYEMDRNEECINVCDRVLALLGTMKNTVPLASPDDMKALHDVQKNHFTHLVPVTFRYIDMFPRFLRDSVLRIQVDCWSALGNKAKITEVGTPLLSKGYRNVMEAFYKIEHPDPYPSVKSEYGLGEDGKVYFYINGEKQ